MLPTFQHTRQPVKTLALLHSPSSLLRVSSADGAQAASREGSTSGAAPAEVSLSKSSVLGKQVLQQLQVMMLYLRILLCSHLQAI